MKKVLSWILMAAMLLSCAAFAEEAPAATVINFEDGNYAMLGISTATGDADASVLSVEDYKDGKALRVDVKAKNPYVSINVEGLMGENLEKVRSISFDVGVEMGPDGKFYAASGKVYTVTSGGDTKMGYDWSVYLKNKNPKTATVTLKDVFFTNGQGDQLLITKESDAFTDSNKYKSGQFPGEEPRDIYLDNIQFLDENGAALPLDLTAEWVNPDAGADLSNLSFLTNAVALEGMNVSAGGWSQAGVSMTEEFRAALVPGSVIEISYESDDGKIWLVFPDSAAGWKRIEQGTATTNNSKDTAQITFTEIAAVLGEDVSTWGDRLQCEGSANWKVYSVKVGTPNAKVSLVNPVEFAGFMCEGGGWAQNGFNFTQEVLDALQPGTALEISFESENNTMWIVLPDSAAGWKRIGNNGEATIIGDKAYITYEQIVAAVGEDKAGWGARLQCEAGANWKVYAVNVGKVSKMVGIYDKVDFEGFACEAGGWAQAGFEMPAEFVAALKPGAVITISYESENGKIWIVMPDSAAGWKRIGNNDMMNCDGTTAQITFEEIAAVLGEDVSAWGARLQCEGSAAWKVYSVNVGMAQ